MTANGFVCVLPLGIFFLIFGGHVLFVEPLIPLFWTSSDISTGFQSQRGQPDSCLVVAFLLLVP